MLNWLCSLVWSIWLSYAVRWTKLHKIWGIKLNQIANFDLCLVQSNAVAFEVFSLGSIYVSARLCDYCLIYKICFYYTWLTAFLCGDHKADIFVSFDWSLCLFADVIKPLLCTYPCISLSLILFHSASSLYLTLRRFLKMKSTLSCHWFILLTQACPDSHHWLPLHTLLGSLMNKPRV